MIEIIDNEEKFLKLSKVWIELEVGRSMRIFQTFDWCWNAWQVCLKQCAQCELHILHWSLEERAEHVILPCYIDNNGTLRYIFDQHGDVLEAVYLNNAINLHYAFYELAEEIIKNRKIRFVHLQKMDGASLALNYLSVFLRGAVVSRDNAYSWIKTIVTDDFASSQSQFKTKDRKRVKAILRKVNEYEYCLFSKCGGHSYPEQQIKSLRDYMVKEIRGSVDFFNDDMIAFARKLYDCGLCEVPMLMKDGVPQILAYRLLKDDRIVCWVVLYRDAKLTSELHVRYMSEKSRQSEHLFDFGVGVYGYKLGTFRPQMALTYSLRYGKGFLGQVKAIFQANVRFLKDVVKSYK